MVGHARWAGVLVQRVCKAIIFSNVKLVLFICLRACVHYVVIVHHVFPPGIGLFAPLAPGAIRHDRLLH